MLAEVDPRRCPNVGLNAEALCLARMMAGSGKGKGLGQAVENSRLLGGRHAGNWDLIDCGIGGERDLIVIREEMGAEEEEAKQ